MSEIFVINDFRPILPEIFLCLSAVFLLMVGVYSGNRSTAIINVAAIIAMVMTIYMEIINVSGVREVFANMFISDRFTSFGKVLILFGGIISLILSNSWLRVEENERFEFPVLILFSVLGLMLMVSAADMLAFYMGLELSSLALYVLAAFNRDRLTSSEAGLKYFVLGSLASGILLFGMSLVYGFSGTINFGMLAQTVSEMSGGNPLPVMVSYGLVTGMVFVLVGLCFKISAVPFHMWTPDVYQGAPTPVTAFFAIAPKIAALLLLMRLLEQPFADMKFFWQQIITLASVGSMLLGALGALMQDNIKRLLAYSSIGHVGYVLIGVAAGGYEGTKSVLVYMTLYLLMSAGAFGCLLLMRRKGRYLESLSDLAGISHIHPQFAIALATIMFSMAGIPPLAGFFGKLFVFQAAISEGLYGLAIVGVLSSVIAAFYYLKVVKLMYFDEGGELFDTMNPFIRTMVSICVIMVVMFLLQPSVLTLPAQAAVDALYAL